jgi:hypothetical protein
MYDSEEEAEQERLQREGKPLNMNVVNDAKGKQFEMIETPMEDYDANQQMKKNQQYKAAPGVKFVEYDEHGFDKREGLSQFVTTDDTIPDVYI